MRFSIGLVVVISSFTLVGCATPDERTVAALEKELGLDSAPYFPKCLSEEVAPKAGVVAGEYSLANTIDNPQGTVAIDRCVRWDTNEPPGKSKDKPQKLILTPPEKGDSDHEDFPNSDS
jgi:hypothetical protein